MSKINELTLEQESALISHRTEWLKIGLATGPCNIDALRDVIADYVRYWMEIPVLPEYPI